ncbi:hypothetical protein M0D46_06040 [Xanthomonas prunicola]|uniref:hypothetical protein n=1 Tax=Xanthomonas prunicola TaxID=2053930 RepID=UPI0021B4AFAE|nr:hypothetical protein [Xanthomonas prunicola]UXA70602.1 hypothetical protein M0D46_06040 [Xanthomonas prunicola]
MIFLPGNAAICFPSPRHALWATAQTSQLRHSAINPHQSAGVDPTDASRSAAGTRATVFGRVKTAAAANIFGPHTRLDCSDAECWFRTARVQILWIYANFKVADDDDTYHAR